MSINNQSKKKEIDLKSFLIGFLLAATIFFGLGSSSGSSTQDVRIVGVSTYDNLRIKIDDIGSSVELPVKIKGQPLEIKLK